MIKQAILHVTFSSNLSFHLQCLIWIFTFSYADICTFHYFSAGMSFKTLFYKIIRRHEYTWELSDWQPWMDKTSYSTCIVPCLLIKFHTGTVLLLLMDYTSWTNWISRNKLPLPLLPLQVQWRHSTMCWTLVLGEGGGPAKGVSWPDFNSCLYCANHGSRNLRIWQGRGIFCFIPIERRAWSQAVHVFFVFFNSH